MKKVTKNNQNIQNNIRSEINFINDMKTLRTNLSGIDKSLKGYGYKYQNFNDIVGEIYSVIEKHDLQLDFKQLPTFTVVESQQVLHVVRTTFYSTSTGYKDSFDTPILTENLQWNNENGSKNVNTLPQRVGSSITYFKRYALVAYLNIRSEVDTDAAPIGNNYENENSTPNKQISVNQKQEERKKDINQIQNFDKKLKIGKSYCYEIFRNALLNLKNWVNEDKEKQNINALIRALCVDNSNLLDNILEKNSKLKSIEYWTKILKDYFHKTNKLDDLNKFEKFVSDKESVYDTSVLKFFCMLKEERQFDYIFAL
ncbi:ERF family protein [Borreliella yangtzensis]|uniref:Erf family protein n=1 Tax=Borreliella yangtzensis TaxID=683292 RepID=A0ABR6PB74_9SPIR|nr:hypothetical protein [Borreliella yangtzensis]